MKSETAGKPLPMKELASRINAYLKRFEANPATNPINEKYKTRPFYQAGSAYTGGSRLTVWYVSYQGHASITKTDATQYLAWLDAGNVGRHWDALRKD